MQLTAHKCNLQRINATFAENKCNFLPLLLQQKLALVITKRQSRQKREMEPEQRHIDLTVAMILKG